MNSENPWSEYVGDYISEVLVGYLKDNIDSNVYSDNIGTNVRKWLINEFSLADLGVAWCYERIQWWANQYDFVREIFVRDVNFEQLSILMVLIIILILV